jgi:hypothetical protein
MFFSHIQAAQKAHSRVGASPKPARSTMQNRLSDEGFKHEKKQVAHARVGANGASQVQALKLAE